MYGTRGPKVPSLIPAQKNEKPAPRTFSVCRGSGDGDVDAGSDGNGGVSNGDVDVGASMVTTVRALPCLRICRSSWCSTGGWSSSVIVCVEVVMVVE